MSTKLAVTAQLAYLVRAGGRAEHLIYPPSSGRKLVRPAQEYHTMPIADARALDPAPNVHEAGFAFFRHHSDIVDFYDDAVVRRDYYPEVVAFLREKLGALDVVVFDHNHRSAVRAAAGQHGVRTPVDAAHVDYTPSSGPRRAAEILAAAGKSGYGKHHLALINLWRPIIGPAQDVPLAVCDPRSASAADYVETDIHHFAEEDLEHPRHSGQIYSFCHAPGHRWYYVPDMQPDEVLLLMNWDSHATGHHCYAPHTGFRNPLAPADTLPRESIEARTLVIFDA